VSGPCTGCEHRAGCHHRCRACGDRPARKDSQGLCLECARPWWFQTHRTPRRLDTLGVRDVLHGLPETEREALEVLEWVAFDLGRLTAPQAEAIGRLLKLSEGPLGPLKALGDRARGEWATKPKWAVKEGEG